MKKIPLSVFMDTLFVFAVSLLSAFVLINYYISKEYAIALSLALALCAALLTLKLLDRKTATISVKKAEKEYRLNVLNQLCLYSRQSVNSLLEKAFSNADVAIERKKTGLFLPKYNALVYPAFCFDGLSKVEVIKAFNKIDRKENVFIFTDHCSADTLEFCERFNGRITVIDGNSVYALLKQADALPEITTVLTKNRGSFKEILSTFFTGKRAKGYFLLAVVLLGFSFLVPYKAYYVAVGCILLVLSLFCRFYGRKEPEQFKF